MNISSLVADHAPFRKIRLRASSGVSVAVAVIVAVFILWGVCRSFKSGRSEIPTVAVARVTRQDLSDYMTLQADFAPYQDILVHAKVSGYVSQIPVDIGDRVKTGDLLAQLEIPELQDNLNKAIAAFQAAQQEVSRIEAASTDTHRIFQRLGDVAKAHPKLIAQQDLDTAGSKDTAAAAALEAARHKAQECQAEEARINTLLSYSRITAPFDGVITKRFADTGSLVQAGTRSDTQAMPVVELAQCSLLRLWFPVPEAEAPFIHPGKDVKVTVDALHKTFDGKIARSAWKIESSTRTMVTEVDVENPDGALQAGMYASIQLPLHEKRNTLCVPVQALSAASHPTVLVLGRDGRIEERTITVGVQTGGLEEVLSGLTEGERVVVGSRAGLQTGERANGKPLHAADLTWNA